MADPSVQPPKPRFDMTANLSTALVIGTMIVGLVGSYTLSGYRLDALEKKSDRIEAKIDGLKPMEINAAVVEQRLRDFERRLSLAEHR